MRLRALLLVTIALSLFSSPSNASAQKGPEKVIDQAQKKEEAGDYEGALALYESLLKHNPDYEPALKGLAQVQYWQGNYQAAIDGYAKILEHDPDHVEALVGTGKAYLAMGKQKKAQEFFNRAEKINPENEEVEAAHSQREGKAAIKINGGYITQTMNYAPEAHGEFQTIELDKERSYGFKLYTAFLTKFGQDAFDTQISAHYYFFENTRIDAALSFAPKTAIVPRQSYQVGLAQTFWKITPEIHYQFENYRQADIHRMRSALFFEPFEYLRVGGGYEYQNLRFGTTRRNLNGGFGEIKLTPLDWISVNAFYSRTQSRFEAGRTPTPYINYKANVGGGAFTLNFLGSYSLRLEGSYESRNNGETIGTFNVSAGYFF